MDLEQAKALAQAQLKRFSRPGTVELPLAKRTRGIGGDAAPQDSEADFISLEPTPAAGGYATPSTFMEAMSINDSPARLVLTRGTVHQQILEDTGALVVPKGRYRPPGSIEGVDFDSGSEPPLYLQITGGSQAAVEAAIAQLRRVAEEQPASANPQGKPQALTVPVAFYQQHCAFPFMAEITGPQGSYVKHIEGKTGVRVQIRGRGTPSLVMWITGPSQEALQQAANLCTSLLGVAEKKFQEWMAHPPLPPIAPTPIPPPPSDPPPAFILQAFLDSKK